MNHLELNEERSKCVKAMEVRKYIPFKIRNLVLGEGRPKICVPLVACSREEIEGQISLIQSCPHDLVEWRVDFLEGCQDWARVRPALELIRGSLGDTVVLFTFRTKPEGGEAGITLEAYEALCLEAAASGMVDLVDVEYHLGAEAVRRLTEKLQERGVGVIVSCHDFAKTPERDEMIHILCEMQRLGADITKMAVMPQSRGDVVTLLQASVDMEERYADRPFITMSMGRLGAASRLAGSLTGSALTFASAGRASAPGQMSAEGIRAALELLG